LPQPPLEYTLFPYTTLFRSLRTFAAPQAWYSVPPFLHALRASSSCNETNLRAAVRPFLGTPTTRGLCLESWQRHAGKGAAGNPGDRKSTRLNSSHVAISYAV